jgi:hypothetical protein
MNIGWLFLPNIKLILRERIENSGMLFQPGVFNSLYLENSQLTICTKQKSNYVLTFFDGYALQAVEGVLLI